MIVWVVYANNRAINTCWHHFENVRYSNPFHSPCYVHVVMHILQMRKLRLKEGEEPCPRSLVNKQHSWDLNPGTWP